MLTVTSVFAYSNSPPLPSNYTLAGSDSTSVTGVKPLVRGEGGDRPHQFLDEFRLSASPDRLTLANVQHYEPGGDLLLQILTETATANAQKSSHYTTNPTRRILDRYEPALGGGWAAFGTTIAGDAGEVAIVKLATPRESVSFKGFGKFPESKPVKYETPAGCPALPFLANVDDETAQATYDRYGITPKEGETYWQAVKRSGCPIAITEGLKKALCLIAKGVPAIAVRGVACWHPKGEKLLYQAIADFATVGRSVYICYDQDLKPSTVKAVGIQMHQLGKALERCGVDVRVMTWHPEEGKGIDDAIFAKGDGGQAWLDDVLKFAQPFKTWVKAGMDQRLMESIRRSKKLPFAPDRDTEGGFMPEIPNVEVGTIAILEAPTAAGKTQEITRQVAIWKAAGGNVMFLYSLNSLGMQSADRCKNEEGEPLPHIRDFWMEGGGDGQAGQEAFLHAIGGHQGVALCFDSLHHIPAWFYKKPLLLILDEVNQGLDHLALGGTLKERQAEIIGMFADALKVAGQSGAIILAEARVYPQSVVLVKRLSGCDNVKYYRHDRTVDRGGVELSKTMNSGALVTQALESLGRGEKIMWCSSSQKNTRKMEVILGSHGYNVVRIDSETNRGTGDGEPSPFLEFFTDPDKFLEAHGCPDALIVSPTCKTGLSIEKPWFDRVFGYFPNCDSDTAMQMLTRFRLPVPRHVAVPPFVNVSGYESLTTSKGVKARIGYNQKVSAQYLNLETIAMADDREAETAAAFVDFYAAAAALRGAQKQIAHRCLADTLEGEGFEVIEGSSDRSKPGEAEMRAAQEFIWREDAETLATSEASEEWRSEENKPQTLAAEWSTIKGKLTEEYSGMDWNCPETCYYAYTRLDGMMPRGVEVQAACEDLEAANLMDREGLQSAAKTGLSYKSPTGHLKSFLLNKIGALRLLEDGLILENDNPVCIEVANLARSFRKDLRFYSGLQIGDEYIDPKDRRVHSPIDVCGKLLKLFGLKFDVVSRPTIGGMRVRHYEVAPIVPKVHDDLNNAYHNSEIEAQDRLEALKYRQKLLEAARERLTRLKDLNRSGQPTSPEESSSGDTEAPSDFTEYSNPVDSESSDEDEVFEFFYEFDPDEVTI